MKSSILVFIKIIYKVLLSKKLFISIFQIEISREIKFQKDIYE